MSGTADSVLLDVRDLRTHFFTRYGVAKAVDGVSFHVREGETLGLVGESGCGKTVTSLSIVRMVPRPAGRIVGGEVRLAGENLLEMDEKEMQRVRGRKVAMILQDPMMSLDPVFSIGEQVAEPIRWHQKVTGSALWEHVVSMLRLVKIPAPDVRVREFPHQMSGGMRQRIVGAIGLSCQPRLLIADEPTTSLDVTIQGQFLQLLSELKEQRGLSMILITHNLGIVAWVCDRVAIMYAGRIVETAPVVEIFHRPQHPYTQALIGSVPRFGQRVRRLTAIEGQPADVRQLPPGCSFHPRCPHAKDVCRREYPPERALGPQHRVSCWLVDGQGHD
ncbi:MAG: ABC transporter ATP-binding protein [Chloroflexi bacterium]|nr:ABC transporter ATP-binding protein [Chloroflexota bacterium]